MKLPNQKSDLRRVLETVNDSLDGLRPPARSRRPADRIKSALPGVSSGNSLKAGLPQGNVAKAGLIVGGLAGLTAGSAGISSLRRRTEGARDDS